jgi:acetyltransferase
MGRRSTPEDLRERFFERVPGFPHEAAARLSQIDYDREMALIALESDGAVTGVARLICDPDFVRAEYAVMVRSDRRGRGLGHALLGAVLDYGRARGVRRVEGEETADDGEGLSLARALGARLGAVDAGVVPVIFELEAGEPAAAA